MHILIQLRSATTNWKSLLHRSDSHQISLTAQLGLNHTESHLQLSHLILYTQTHTYTTCTQSQLQTNLANSLHFD
jgi:hypothetical protein